MHRHAKSPRIRQVNGHLSVRFPMPCRQTTMSNQGNGHHLTVRPYRHTIMSSRRTIVPSRHTITSSRHLLSMGTHSCAIFEMYNTKQSAQQKHAWNSSIYSSNTWMATYHPTFRSAIKFWRKQQGLMYANWTGAVNVTATFLDQATNELRALFVGMRETTRMANLTRYFPRLFVFCRALILASPKEPKIGIMWSHKLEHAI